MTFVFVKIILQKYKENVSATIILSAKIIPAFALIHSLMYKMSAHVRIIFRIINVNNAMYFAKRATGLD
jgi:hypothetical protein